jgi:ketosteroid isomerase-like protein
MSQQNVEFVRGLFAAASDMGKEALLAALPELIAQTCDPEIEWCEDPQRADGRVHRGHGGVRESFERWLDQWDEYGAEAERFIDCGDDVLVVAREHGRGARSGATVSSRIFMVVTTRVSRRRKEPDMHHPALPPAEAEAIAGELAEWSDDLLVDDGYAAALLRVASFALDSYAAGQPRARDRDRDRGLAS